MTYLERLCVFGRDGCDGGKDERIIALNKLHTSVQTILIRYEKKTESYNYFNLLNSAKNVHII